MYLFPLFMNLFFFILLHLLKSFTFSISFLIETFTFSIFISSDGWDHYRKIIIIKIKFKIKNNITKFT